MTIAILNNVPGAPAIAIPFGFADVAGNVVPQPPGTLFTVPDDQFDPDYVIGADGTSLRPITPQETQDGLRRQRISTVDDVAKQVLVGGFQYDDRWYGSDEGVRTRMGLRAFAIESGQYRKSNFFWPDFDGARVRFRRRDFEKLVKAYDDHFQATADAALLIKSQLESAADPNAVDITQGWPPTRATLSAE